MELFRDENSGFFLTNIDPDISGLPMRIYTYPHLYTNSLPQQLQVPSILVSNWIGHRTAIWNDDNFMLSIENHLRLLEGRCKISRSDLNSVKEWSRLNRTVLIANWEGSLSTPELFDDLKRLETGTSRSEWRSRLGFESVTFDSRTHGIPWTLVNFETRGADRGFVLRVSNIPNRFVKYDSYTLDVRHRELIEGQPHDRGARIYELVRRWIFQPMVVATLWNYYIRESEMCVDKLLHRLESYQLRIRS